MCARSLGHAPHSLVTPWATVVRSLHFFNSLLNVFERPALPTASQQQTRHQDTLACRFILSLYYKLFSIHFILIWLSFERRFKMPYREESIF